jgi:hypothetical protein
MSPKTKKCGGGRVSCGVLANEYSCAHGAQINFGDLTPNLTYADPHPEPVDPDSRQDPTSWTKKYQQFLQIYTFKWFNLL